VALTARLRRCSDCVSYVMYFCRAGEATTMPLHDPQPTSRTSLHCDAAFA
jgi:hypothetical protein